MALFKRLIFKGQPTFTEKDYPDLSDKIYIVTGASSGIGEECSRLLLSKGAKVYLAGRNQQKLEGVIEKFQADMPECKVDYFLVDFSDLATIKPGVQKFLDQETRLDGILHSAGVMASPIDWKTKQGWDIQLGTNTIAPWLLQKCLDDIIVQTGKQTADGSVRIMWVASDLLNRAPKNGGVDWDDINNEKQKMSKWTMYGQTKAMTMQQAVQWGKIHSDSGVLSFSAHPGVLQTGLTRNLSVVERCVLKFIAYPVIDGAYAILFPVLSPKLTSEDNGAFFMPFEHKSEPRADIGAAARDERGEKVVKWLDSQVKDYL